jgi:prepilin-type processing-associated H-X9-DG protein
LTVVGNSGEWSDLLDPQVPEIVKLILEGWGLMGPIAPDSKEDPISLELCKKLRSVKNSSHLSLRIYPQFVELDSKAHGVDLGRIDIVFAPLVPDEEVYFALECKRVNVAHADGSVRGYYSEYVTEGLSRFVSGQYSSEVRHGGMIAFVLDGNVAEAMKGIVRNINAKSGPLGLTAAGVEASQYLPTNPSVRQTTHQRAVAAGEVVVQHFFLAST